MKRRWPKWIRWAWMLPVAELLVAAVVAGPPAVQRLRHPPHLYRAADGRIIIEMLSDPAAVRLLAEGGPRFPSRFQDVSYLNIPAMLIEIPISLPTSWHDSYQPKWAWPIGLDGFRAITWPIWALPFWFFAGRGFDSLFRRGRITVSEAFFMGALGSFIALSIIMIPICGSPQPADEKYQNWVLLPLIMWFVFGVICQFAWWRQRSERRTTCVIVNPG